MLCAQQPVWEAQPRFSNAHTALCMLPAGLLQSLAPRVCTTLQMSEGLEILEYG